MNTLVRAEITSVCVTQALQPRTARSSTPTGINKAPVPGVTVTTTGVVGDKVLDTKHHGGVDKAVYAYAEEDARWWSEQLDEDIPAGRFGENLRTRGVDLVGAVIGERWQIGEEVVVEVSEPRVPCATFQHHMDQRSGWVKRFTEAGRIGTYLRVIRPGDVMAGDTVDVVSRPDHGVTVGRWFRYNSPGDARALLEAESEAWQMGPALRAYVERALPAGL